ncbi:MAG TPA: ATP synthase F1 subunit delta [Clostridiales bacterium]|nr:ATP synthase F1 subunit delta [Clostridiales bacterium]
MGGNGLLKGSVVARRYARALYEAAAAAGAPDAVGRDLRAAVGAIWGEEGLREFLLSERVASGAKKRLVRELTGRGVHRLVRNLLLLTVDKRRTSYLPEIVELYGLLEDRARGVARVEVRTAVPLDEPARREMESVLSAKLGRRVRLSFKVDPSILGGVQVKVDDRLLDASLKRRLERLGERLAKVRVGV